jgi:hypothetical protein
MKAYLVTGAGAAIVLLLAGFTVGLKVRDDNIDVHLKAWDTSLTIGNSQKIVRSLEGDLKKAVTDKQSLEQKISNAEVRLETMSKQLDAAKAAERDARTGVALHEASREREWRDTKATVSEKDGIIASLEDKLEKLRRSAQPQIVAEAPLPRTPEKPAEMRGLLARGCPVGLNVGQTYPVKDGFGLKGDRYLRAATLQACDDTHALIVIDEKDPPISFGRSSSMCTELKHYNSVSVGQRLRIPHTCLQ